MSKNILMLLFLMLVLISVSAVSAVDVDDNNTIVSSADAEALAVENDVGTIDDLNEDVAGGDDVALSNDAKSVAVGKSNEIYGETYENSSSQLLAASDDNVLENNQNILAMANNDVENDEILQNPNSDDVLGISIMGDSNFPSEINMGEQFSFYIHVDMPALQYVKLDFGDDMHEWNGGLGPRNTLEYTYNGHTTGDMSVTVTVRGADSTTDTKTFSTTIIASTPAASVSVNNSTLDLFVDDNFTIVPTTTPAGLNVTYVSDNSGVVSVENGVVTALKEGTATITVKVGDGKVYAENSTLLLSL